MKLLPRDLNPDPCPPHSTSTYICKVTIAPMVCGGDWSVVRRPPKRRVRWHVYDITIHGNLCFCCCD